MRSNFYRTQRKGMIHHSLSLVYSAPQACRPKVVAMAVNTVITIFRILLQRLFLFSKQADTTYQTDE